MENQFPELFNGKTILYVHGFASSGQSGTVRRLREAFPSAKVVAPDLPIHPAEALQLLRDTCESERPDLILGTSMGGMYAEMLYGFDRILVNPALRIADTMQEHGLTGQQHFLNPRKDGVQDFIVTKAMVKEYQAVTDQCFAHAADPGEQERVFGLFADEDQLVHTQPLFRQHYAQAIPFHGEHRMNDHAFLHSILPLMRWIDDRQEDRQRPVLAIALEALRDGYGQPRSNAQKTIRQLLATYDIHFVAPTENASDTISWLTQYIGVPAWHHTVLTDQPRLLLADYFVTAQPIDSLATTLVMPSDTFKSWEDLQVYFQRLGGQ